MRYFILISLLSLMYPCFAEEDSHVHTEGRTSLTVNIINGTVNGHSITGDEVTVEIYEDDKHVDTLLGKVGNTGKAVFKNIKLTNHLAAYPRVRHMDMNFSSRPVTLCPDTEQVGAGVHVFDVSFDRSPLSVTTHHIMLKQKDNSVIVSEFLQLKNSSDMAISSKKRDKQDRPVILEMSLPKGFKDFSSVSYFEPEALVFSEDGFYDAMAVPPGSHKIVFSYTLDIKAEQMPMAKKITLPTSALIVFSQLEQASIEGLGASNGQFVMDDGSPAEYYMQNSLAAGEEITFIVTGLNVGIADKISWIIPTVIFGAVMILAIYRALSKS